MYTYIKFVDNWISNIFINWYYIGIDNFANEFRSWDWNFGKTPKFTVTRTLDFPAHDGKIYRLNLSLEIQNCIVEEIRMTLPAELVSTDFAQDVSVISNIRGTRYDHEVTENIIAAIGGKTVTLNTTQSVDENNMKLDEATLQWPEISGNHNSAPSVIVFKRK